MRTSLPLIVIMTFILILSGLIQYMPSISGAAGTLDGYQDTIEVVPDTTGTVNLFISYAHPPTETDERALAQYLSVDAYRPYRCKYTTTICAYDVLTSAVPSILELPGVTGIEVQPLIHPTLDIAVAGAKVRPSTIYPDEVAWKLGYNGSGINIAILDTGVDDEHESLTGKFVAGADVTPLGELTAKDGSYNPDDRNGHGTHVASIAMGTGGASGTYKGSAPEAHLIDVKVLNDLQTSGYFVEGLEWCIDHRNTDWNGNGPDAFDGIDVLCISLGGSANSDGSDTIGRTINSAVNHGMVVVTAIGNTGPDYEGLASVPAADRAITVGNLNDQSTVKRTDDELNPSSTVGPRRSDGDANPFDEMKPDVCAPGTAIRAAQAATMPLGVATNGYTEMTGSSMSAPLVAGIVAMMLEANPDLKPNELINPCQRILHLSTDPKGTADRPELSPIYNRSYGWGIVDGYRAVSKALTYVPTPDAYVTNIAYSDPEPIEEKAIDITLTLYNIGELPVNGAIVELYIDEVKIGERTLDVPIDDPKTALFQWTTLGVGVHDVKGKISYEMSSHVYPTTIKVKPRPHPTSDLRVTEIEFVPAAPKDGEEVDITATIENTGSQDAASVIVRFYRDMTVLEEIEVGVPKYSTRSATTRWLTESTGEFEIKVEIVDDDPTNDLVKVMTVFPYEPDLSIESITVSPAEPNLYINENALITAAIKNAGQGNAESVLVRIKDNGELIYTSTIATILAGEKSQVAAPWIPKTDGTHVITVQIEYQEIIAEKTANVIVNKRAPEFIITSYSFSPSNPQVGETTRVIVKIDNIGDGDAIDVDYRIVDGSVEIKTGKFTVFAGENTKITFDTTFKSAGKHDIRVELGEDVEETKSIDVRKTPSEGETSFLPGFETVFAVGAIAIAALIGFSFSTHRRRH